MSTREPLLQRCLTEIETQLNWGEAAEWSNQVFDELGDRIATTLDTLARFVGHEGWRDYRARRESPPETEEGVFPLRRASSTSIRVTGIVVLLIATVVVLLLRAEFAAPASPPLSPLVSTGFALELSSIGEGVPTSAIFTYDACKAPSDEIYLQQSWDTRRRERLGRGRPDG